MRKLLLILLFIVFVAQPCLGAIDPSIDNKHTYKNAYRWTGKPKDRLLDWAQAMEDAVDGTTGVPSLYFSGLTTVVGEALTTEGTLFYDTDTSNLKYYTSSWQTVASSTSSTLDEAYSAGQGITVDAGTVALTATDTANNIVLTVTQGDTGAVVGQIIVNAGTGAALSFDSNGAGGDVLGSDSSWNISKVGLATFGGGGVWSTCDVLFDATSASEDVQWDEDAQMMHFLDGAILGIGGAVNAAADMTFESDGTNVLVEVATEDDADLIFGSTEAFDFKICANTATDYVVFDSGAAALIATDYDMWLDDTSDVFFGTTKNIGFLLAWDSSKTMSLLAGAASDDFAFNLGKDQQGVDLGLFGTTASASALWDSTADAFWFNGADIALGDDDKILLGDTLGTGDFSISVDSSAKLLFLQVAADTGTIEYGIDGTGYDVTWFGEDASAYMKWEGNGANNNTLNIVGIDSSDTVLKLTGVNTTTDSDTMTIAHSGAGAGIDFALGSTDSVAIDVLCKAAQTTSSVILQGGTGAADWDGADNIGMLHLTHDSAVVDAGASQLVILQETATKNDAEGFLARFISTATAQASAFAVEIECPVTQPGLKLNTNLTIAGQGATDGVLFNLTSAGTAADAVQLVGVSNDVLQVTANATGTTGIHIVGVASTTVSLQKIIGDAGAGWIGNSNIGMLHLTNDGTAAQTSTTLLRVAQAGTNISGQKAICADFVDTSTSGGGTEYVVRISSTNNSGLYVDSGGIVVDDFVTATKGLQVGVGETMTTAAAEGATQQIDDGVTFANVTTTTGVNEFITLPNDPPIGTVVYVMNNVGANFEIRTLVAGNDSINNIDTSDAGTEYLCTSGGANNGDLVQFTYVTADRWIGVSYTYLGAVRAAVVPD